MESLKTSPAAGAGILKFILLSGSILLSVLIAEGLFRWILVEPQVPENDRQFKKMIAARWPKPVSTEKKDGTFRILGLSDSYGTYGGASNYHYRLEKILKEKGRNVEVVNFSLPGYGPNQTLKIFRRFAASYEPDFVLYGFYVGNDFTAPEGRYVDFGNIPFWDDKPFRVHRPESYFLYKWVKNYGIYRDERRRIDEEVAAVGKRHKLSKKGFLFRQRRDLELTRKTPAPERRWQNTARQLEALHQAFRDSGIPYAVVFHPQKFQAEEKQLSEIATAHPLNPADYDLTLPQKFLKEFYGSRQVPFLDLLPVFKEKGSRGGLFYAQDAHYTAKGNALAAEALAEFLTGAGY
jgi:hypothetical protein